MYKKIGLVKLIGSWERVVGFMMNELNKGNDCIIREDDKIIELWVID